jgi:hypothetical protein
MRSLNVKKSYTSLQLAPMPFIKKQSKFNTKPEVPAIYVVINPERQTDKGTNNPPTKTARSRSSGTQVPFRRAFHFSTIASDNRPAIGEATCV